MGESGKEKDGAGGDFSLHFYEPFMAGIFLAVNAVPDAYLLVEGPDCTHLKVEYVQGNHDLHSSLVSVSGFHRISNTALHIAQVALSREEILLERLGRLAAYPPAGLVLLTSMSMAFITGADYGRLCKKTAAKHGKPVMNVPGRSFSSDWMNGYEETLYALAQNLPIKRRAHEGIRVGLVGYLFDRSEEDHRGNLRELSRMLEALGVTPSSVWLSGTPVSGLLDIGDSDFIVSLPYGRRAAKVVADRLGVPLLETSYPFGLEASATWLKTLAQHLGRQTEAETFIENELGRIIPKLEWTIRFVFQQKRFAYVGDPVLLPGFAEIVGLLGGVLGYAVVLNQPKNAPDPETLPPGLDRLCLNPSHRSVTSFFERLGQPQVDCLVSSKRELAVPGAPARVDFGFPSYTRHCLYDRPFLGFNGSLAFTDMLLNALLPLL